MRKKGFIICTLLLVGSFAFGNKKAEVKSMPKTEVTTICGQVKDKVSGEELAGVCVKIEGTDIKTYSDFEGNYTFENIKEGNYKLLVEYISYKTVATPSIEVKGAETHMVNFKIDQLH